MESIRSQQRSNLNRKQSEISNRFPFICITGRRKCIKTRKGWHSRIDCSSSTQFAASKSGFISCWPDICRTIPGWFQTLCHRSNNLSGQHRPTHQFACHKTFERMHQATWSTSTNGTTANNARTATVIASTIETIASTDEQILSNISTKWELASTGKATQRDVGATTESTIFCWWTTTNAILWWWNHSDQYATDVATDRCWWLTRLATMVNPIERTTLFALYSDR